MKLSDICNLPTSNTLIIVNRSELVLAHGESHILLDTLNSDLLDMAIYDIKQLDDIDIAEVLNHTFPNSYYYSALKITLKTNRDFK